MTAEQLTAEQLTAEQLRTLDAEVEAVVFNLTWYRVRHDDTGQNGGSFVSDGGSFVSDRLLPPATAALYRAWGWSVKAISPEEGLVGFLAGTPRYSTDIAAAWDMEAELQRQGLHFAYGLNLSPLICAAMPDNAHAYHVAHASPELRCRAALATVREAKDND